jgi:hypothetical protein
MALKLDNVVTIVMVVLGVVLFVVALWVLKVLLAKSKPVTPAYGLFGIAVIMIGFSTITSVTFPGGGGFSKNAKNFEADPNNPKTIAALEDDLDKHLNPTNTIQLPKGARADLAKAVASLGSRTNLSVQSRITLSKAQLALGRTNDAASTLKSVVAANPRLSTDPKVKMLMRRIE